MTIILVHYDENKIKKEQGKQDHAAQWIIRSTGGGNVSFRNGAHDQHATG